MKKNENKIIKFLKPAFNAGFGVIIFLTFLFIIMFFSSFTKNMTENHVNTAAKLTAKSFKNYLDGVKNEVKFVANHEKVNNIKSKGVLTNNLSNFKHKAVALVESFEVEVAGFLRVVYDLNSTFIYMKNLPKAYDRLITRLITMNFDDDEDDDDHGNDEEEYHEEYKVHHRTVPLIINGFVSKVEKTVALAQIFTRFLDNFDMFRQGMLHDEGLTNLIVARALDSGNIKGITVKNLDGIELINSDLVNISNPFSTDVDSILKGRSFFDGGVVYSGGNKPFWWLGLPIRDYNRRLVGSLGAYIDLERALPGADGLDGNLRITVTDDEDRCIYTGRKVHGGKGTVSGIAMLREAGIEWVPDLKIIVHGDSYKYLNDYYYECILSMVVLFTAACYFMLAGILGFKNIYNSEVKTT